MTLPHHFVVAGVNGKFGRIFARKLLSASRRVSGIDLQAEATVDALERYVCGDVCQPSPDVLATLRGTDALLLCIHEEAIINALPGLLNALPSGALVMDVASVKSHVADVMQGENFDGEYLSLHPMFGPTEDFSGRNLAVVPLRPGPKSTTVLELLREWGAHLTTVTADEHDRAAAWLQAGAHAMLLAWAGAARQVDVPTETLFALSTPLSTTLLALIARTLAAGADLAHELQYSGPYAYRVRRHLQQELVKLDEIMELDDCDALGEHFVELEAFLGGTMESRRELAGQIVELARSS